MKEEHENRLPICIEKGDEPMRLRRKKKPVEGQSLANPPLWLEDFRKPVASQSTENVLHEDTVGEHVVQREHVVVPVSPYIVMNPAQFRGKWKASFRNDRPIYVEIGMGKGKFIGEMSIRQPEINWIGIDKYEALIWMAQEKTANLRREQPKTVYRHRKAMDNIRFVCGHVQHLPAWFAPQEIKRIYLHFCDPWPKTRHVKRRLTHPVFLQLYATMLHPKGEIFFRTDSKQLYDYTLQTLKQERFIIREQSTDINPTTAIDGLDTVMTEYEQKFRAQGKLIYEIHAYNRPRSEGNTL